MTGNESNPKPGSSNCGTDIQKLVVIGNGPSAISLSHILSGNAPYYKGTAEDEYLHKRLSSLDNDTILLQNIEDLATGCEGRSSNPVSVFFDMLNHPNADTGVESDSLLEWKARKDLQLEHKILGKGRAGGCWESLDGNIQTVSFGSWMELPNLRMADLFSNENAETRVKVSDVASYYQEYVKKKELSKYFRDYSEVTSVREIKTLQCSSSLKREIKSVSDLCQQVDKEENAIFGNEYLYESRKEEEEIEGSFEISCTGCSTEDDEESVKTSSSPSACFSSSDSELAPLPNIITSPNNLSRACLSSTPHGIMIQNRYSQKFGMRCSDMDECSARDGELEEIFMYNLCASWDPIVNPKLFRSVSTNSKCDPKLPRERASSFSYRSDFSTSCAVSTCFPDTERLFEISGFTSATTDDNGVVKRTPFKYLSKRVVLATGSYDLPNRLSVPGENLSFVLHSLREFENLVSKGFVEKGSDPILIVGAGLSAADAILTARSAGISIVHAFRKSAHDENLIFKRIPKILYPEYHEVYELMKGGLQEDRYAPFEEHRVTDILSNRRVEIENRRKEKVTISISFVVILIGSSPDLLFLEPKLRSRLGIIKDVPISRHNPVDIDLFTNEAVDVPGIYAMGPLVGDNFVRFLQGGALAIASDVLKAEKQYLSK